MKRIVTLTMLFAAFSVLSFAGAVPHNEQTLTGTVTCDARSAGQYSCKKGETLQSCTLECVAQGFKYQLLVGQDTAYLLDGNRAQLEKFAGGKATVTGVVTADDNRIAVQSVSKAARKSSTSSSGGQ